MISSTSSGNFENIRAFARRVRSKDIFSELDRYGKRGVEALAAATPKESGISASSWEYRVSVKGKRPSISWHNTNVDANGTPIVILIQYGHGTGTGGYVEGFDFINPVIQPIMDEIAENVWKKVRS